VSKYGILRYHMFDIRCLDQMRRWNERRKSFNTWIVKMASHFHMMALDTCFSLYEAADKLNAWRRFDRESQHHPVMLDGAMNQDQDVLSLQLSPFLPHLCIWPRQKPL